jgi:hypothetical protein
MPLPTSGCVPGAFRSRSVAQFSGAVRLEDQLRGLQTLCHRGESPGPAHQAFSILVSGLSRLLSTREKTVLRILAAT